MFAFRLKAYQPFFALICLFGLPPATAADWTHVTAYMLMLDKVTSLAARWTTLRVELAIPAEVDFDFVAAFPSRYDRRSAPTGPHHRSIHVYVSF